MSNEVETVDGVYESDQLYSKQKEGVSKMRTSLLACNPTNGSELLSAINNITAMRIYHQLSRIIRYTEMMDKLEKKMYESMDNMLDNTYEDPVSMLALLKMQEQLQKSMIESHKLLQPYMNISEFEHLQDIGSVEAREVNPAVKLISSRERDNIRNAASSALLKLRPPTGTEG